MLRSSGSSRIERWWRTSSHLVEVPKNFQDQVDEYQELLDSAAALRTRSDVPLGSAVSGGLDSSAVVASVVGQRKQLTGARLPYDAFTIDYVKSAHSEVKYARELCAGLNVPLEVVPIDSSSVGPEELTRIIYSLESIHDPLSAHGDFTNECDSVASWCPSTGTAPMRRSADITIMRVSSWKSL